jgi:glycosyltransferase involved in cell wall biosynthesis
MSSPKVSVIVACFNGEAYIGDCVQSIASQTVRDIEIIVVDDGSSDGTLATVRKLAAADGRIKVYPTRHSGYASIARNIGLSLAIGEFVGFLDDDDLYHPTKLEKCLQLFEAFAEVQIVFHDLRYFEQEPGDTQTFFENVGFLELASSCVQHAGASVFLCEREFYNFASAQFNPVHTSAVMLRRTVLSQVVPWFREDMRLGEDMDLWYRLLKEYRAAFLDEVLSFYRQRPGSLTYDKVRYLTAATRVNTENLARGAAVLTPAEQRALRSKIATEFSDLGYQYFCRSDVRAARSAYRQSMGTRFRSRTLAAYLKTFVPPSVVRVYRNCVQQEGRSSCAKEADLN